MPRDPEAVNPPPLYPSDEVPVPLGMEAALQPRPAPKPAEGPTDADRELVERLTTFFRLPSDVI